MRTGILKTAVPFIHKLGDKDVTVIKQEGSEVFIKAAGKVIVTAVVEIAGQDRVFFLRPEDVDIQEDYTFDFTEQAYYKKIQGGGFLKVIAKDLTGVVSVNFSPVPGDDNCTKEDFENALRRAKEMINELC